MRFAAAHGDVEVQFSGAHPSSAPFERFQTWKPDALIADESVHALSPRAFAALSGQAVVFVNTPPRKNCRKPHASLTTDDRALAKAAAGLFAFKRIPHAAFVGSPGRERWSETRQRHFRAEMRKGARAPDVFSEPRTATWLGQEKALAEWLNGLPKPCGVWAAYDQRAKHVLDACRLAGLSVPEQVQVLGVDNEPLICEQTSPPLSSIAPDFAAGGYAAAQYLKGVLEGRRDNAEILFPVRGIVERLSTADVNGRARHVAAASEFIRKNATHGIGVGDVAAASGISVRLLQKDYPAITGKTVVEAIIDARIDRAKELLRRTATPLSDVAGLSGFPSATYLMTSFKRRVGLTMTAYRTECYRLSGARSIGNQVR